MRLGWVGVGFMGGKGGVGALEVFAEMGGEEGTGRGKGRGRGRKRKAVDQLDGAADADESASKKARSDAG